MKTHYPLLPYWGIFKKDCQFVNEFSKLKAHKMTQKLLRKYNKYKQGEYVSSTFMHNSLIETWIHYQLGETELINIDAINKMSDDVHD